MSAAKSTASAQKRSRERMLELEVAGDMAAAREALRAGTEPRVAMLPWGEPLGAYAGESLASLRVMS